MRTLLRPGPVPLPGDSWDIDASDAAPPHRPVSNHRRGRWRPSPRTNAITAVVVGLFLVAAIWLLPVSALPRSYRGPFGAGTESDALGATKGGPGAVASGVAPVTTPARGTGDHDPAGPGTPPGPDGNGPRSGSGSGSGSGGSGSGAGTFGGGAPPGVVSPTETADPTFAPFTELGYEAEAGLPAVRLLGSAEVVALPGASGGQVVRNLGNWSDATPGSLQLRVNIPATGTYRITLSYVAGAGPGAATLVVAGTGPYPIALPGGSGCCPVTTVDVIIVAGARILTLSKADGPIPAIDRIMITPL